MYPLAMPPFKVGFQFFHFSSTKEETLAEQIVGDGLTFVQAYAKLASLAYASSRPLFAYRPKLHYFHHILLEMRVTVRKGGRPMNPLAFSCSSAEDFIGRASLLSRRTAAQTTERRVLQRYLAAAHDVWTRERNS